MIDGDYSASGRPHRCVPPPGASRHADAARTHIKREQEQAREPKRFRRELIVCAVVAVGSTILTLVIMLVLGNILREIAIETFETLRVWWAGWAAGNR